MYFWKGNRTRAMKNFRKENFFRFGCLMRFAVEWNDKKQTIFSPLTSFPLVLQIVCLSTNEIFSPFSGLKIAKGARRWGNIFSFRFVKLEEKRFWNAFDERGVYLVLLIIEY